MKKSDKFYDIFSYFLLRFFFSSVAYCPLLLPSVFAQYRRFFVCKSLNGSGGNRMLCIKKSRRNGEYIVYNPHHFQLHTHTKHKRIALLIKGNVEHHRVPRSTDLRMLESHIRLTSNKSYLRKLEERRTELLALKAEHRKALLPTA